MRKQVHKEAQTRKSNLELREEFEHIQETEEAEATTKVVNFYYRHRCGCGFGAWDKYHGEFPADFDIFEGQRLADFPECAINIDRGWV